MKKAPQGFTLIETVLYIGLFSLIMGGAVACSYSLVEGMSRTSANVVVEEEGNFVLKKMDWVEAHPGASLRLNAASGSVEINEGNGIWIPITTENIKVTALASSSVTINKRTFIN